MRKFFSAACLVALFFSFLGPVPVAHADGAAISGTDGMTATTGVAKPITDIQITGVVGDTPVKLLVSHGTLAMSLMDGLTFTGGTSGSELYFHGDVADVNAALATLTYTRGSTGVDALEVSLVQPGEVFFADNGHLYEYIAVVDQIDWTDANTAAQLLTRYGATGYLATITSSSENAFAAARLQGAGWIGGSDSVSEGVWNWVVGPEAGTTFWNGAVAGSAPPGQYANWSDSEPNNLGNEDCAQFLSGGGSSGRWNDLPCIGYLLPGYVVEFGAPGDLPATTGAQFSITTYNAPTLTSVTPPDDAVGVDRNSDLVLTFNGAVNVGPGTVDIYRAANDSLVTSIDVTGPRVTGSGTDTITVNPAATLPSRADLYVHISSGAFAATLGGDYAGISDDATWNFTTAGSGGSGIALVPIMGASLVGSSAITSCDGGSATGSLTLQALGATEYLLSNDPNFMTATWQVFTGEATTVNWSFGTNSGQAHAYAAFRNASGAVVYADASVAVTGSCEPEVVAPPTPEPTVSAPLTGPSPWSGVIEPITDTSGMTLIKGEHYDTVYLLEGGKRRPFVNETIYFTRYTNFDEVKSVTDATLGTIPLGLPMLPKAGSLVKIRSLASVYLVKDDAHGEAIEYIPSEEAALVRFGADWARRVLDIDPILFGNFIRL